MRPATLGVFFCLLGLAAAQENPAAAPAPSPAFAPTQTYVISGRLLDALSGAPVGGAVVAIAPVEDRNRWRSTRAVADGSFAFGELAAGKYALLAGNHRFGYQYFNEHGGYSTAIAVGPGLASEPLSFRLQPPASIYGQVVDQDNEPVPEAALQLFRQTLRFGLRSTVLRAGATTDDQGNFHFADLPAGHYLLAVKAHPWYAKNRPASPLPRASTIADLPNPPATTELIEAAHSPLDLTYPVTFYPDTTDAEQAGVLALAPGDRAQAQITLRAVPALRLVLTSSTPAGLSGYISLAQTIFGEEAPLPGLERSQPAPGVAELSGIPPGHYMAQMQTLEGSRRVAVDVFEDTQLNADEAQPVAPLSGDLRFEDGNPPPGGMAVVIFNSETGAQFGAQVSPKYDFSFGDQRIPPGHYQLMLVGNNAPVVASLAASGAGLRGHSLETSGGAARVTIFVSRRLGHVDGVALARGRPVAGAMIVLVPADPENNLTLYRFDQSDSDGTFVLNRILPGKYTAVAIADGWELEWGNPAGLAKYLRRGTPVTVTAAGAQKIRVTVQSE